MNILLPLYMYLFFTWFHIHVNGLYVRVIHSSINLFIKGRITRFQYISKIKTLTVKEFVCYKPLVIVFRIELQQGSQEETKFCFILIPLLVLPLLIFNMPVFCASKPLIIYDRKRVDNLIIILIALAGVFRTKCLLNFPF